MTTHSMHHPDALDAPMKRVSAREMFRLADGYLQATQASTAPLQSARFAILPRYNACVRLHPDAIQVYFSHLHAHRSWRSRVFRGLLKLLARVPATVVHRVPSITVYDPSEAYPNVDWPAVDVLLAEWQFVGLFSGEAGTASHVLASSKYERCFENEVAARETMHPFVSLPQALHIEDGDSRGWTEPFFPNEATLSERRAPFSDFQAEMCDAYADMGERVSTETYLSHLSTCVRARYRAGGNEAIAATLDRLIAWVKLQAKQEGVKSIRLSRGHGDFNPGQVLANGRDRMLIDWSESEMGVVFHDYIQSALWFYKWRDLDMPIHIPDLRVLREGLAHDLAPFSPLLAVALVLTEVGVKQHTDYNEARGTIRSWTDLTAQVLQLAESQSADQSKAVPTLDDRFGHQS